MAMRCAFVLLPQIPQKDCNEDCGGSRCGKAELGGQLRQIVMEMAAVSGHRIPGREVMGVQGLHTARANACNGIRANHPPADFQHLDTLGIRIIVWTRGLDDAGADWARRQDE
jgi:hypothetical protein